MTHDPYKTLKLQHPVRIRLLEVARVTELGPSMRRITLRGDLADFVSASFDDHVKLVLPETPGAKPSLPTLTATGLVFDDTRPRPAMRDYTPRRYDAQGGELDIDFVMHHDGPATDWARHAQPGHLLGTAGPRGSLVIPDIFDWHLLIGDETAIPAIARRLEELPAGSRAIVRIRITREDGKLPLQANGPLDIQWLVGEPGDAASGAGVLESAVRQLTLPDGEGHAWAAGEYSEIKALRRHLVELHGMDKSRVRAASYWRRASPATHERFE